MARTPLAGRLQRIVAEVAAEHEPTQPSGEGHSRRDFLRRAGLGAAAAAASGGVLGWAPQAAAQTALAKPIADARVVVVGAGLAGLTAAYRLKQAGLQPQVHEASTRIGGRCWTLRGTFADGQIAERGGEFIDTSHTRIRQLVQELGLTTDNLLRSQTIGTEDVFYFDNQVYTYAQASEDIRLVWLKMQRDTSDASYPTTYTTSTPRGRQLDNMSIVDYINETVPGGMSSKLGQLLEVAYTIEYGLESSEQSALNLLYLIGYKGQGRLSIFGPSDEKYRVVGGNDQIATRLADQLSGNITTGSELVAIAQTSSGGYTLTFRQGRSTTSVAADKVVLALPFSILRSVDYSKAGFRPVKQTAIRELGMGTNTKLTVQFTDRHWRGLGYNGNTYADTGYQCSWEVSRAQAGNSGILVDYTGGAIGAGFNKGKLSTITTRFLDQIEPLYPGLKAKYNGRSFLDYWTAYPWTKGSYSCWKVGQYQRFAGSEGEREGNCHFAGEHTSLDFQGYLNGAVETGQRACDEILADLR